MDPNATFQQLLDNLNEFNLEQLQQSFDDLYKWLSNGGFPPTAKHLGYKLVATANGHKEEPRTFIPSPNRKYAIMTLNDSLNDTSKLQFVEYYPDMNQKNIEHKFVWFFKEA